MRSDTQRLLLKMSRSVIQWVVYPYLKMFPVISHYVTVRFSLSSIVISVFICAGVLLICPIGLIITNAALLEAFRGIVTDCHLNWAVLKFC